MKFGNVRPLFPLADVPTLGFGRIAKYLLKSGVQNLEPELAIGAGIFRLGPARPAGPSSLLLPWPGNFSSCSTPHTYALT